MSRGRERLDVVKTVDKNGRECGHPCVWLAAIHIGTGHGGQPWVEKAAAGQC